MNFKANFVIYITYRFVTQGHRLNIDRTYVRYAKNEHVSVIFGVSRRNQKCSI